jgi:hypothetical protein
MKKFMFSGAAGCCVSFIASENVDEADLEKASDAVTALWENLTETLPDGAEFSGELTLE